LGAHKRAFVSEVIVSGWIAVADKRDKFAETVAELLDAGVIKAEALAQRLDRVGNGITEDAHGEAARDLVTHLTDWLRSVQDLPAPHPLPWSAPPITGPAPPRLE
jgi:hypothetical protein